CDVAENCDGVNNNCPPDGFRPATFQCRASAGACDPAETCPGSGPTCPADAKSVAVCRPVAGNCDAAESCDGLTNDCPPHLFLPPTEICRPAAPQCDILEMCTGTSATCPANVFLPNGTSCNDANTCTVNDACADGVCTGAPTCTDPYLCYKVKATVPFTQSIV